MKEEAFTAFGDDSEPSSSSSSSSKAALAVAEPAQRQQPQRGSGPASARADKLRSEAGTPQRAREAIDAGLQKFAAGEYQTAVDLFQLSLEVRWWREGGGGPWRRCKSGTGRGGWAKLQRYAERAAVLH